MDSYLVSKNEAVRLAFFLVNMGRITKVTLINKAKKGSVPSGFDNSQGPIRISWLEDKDIADAILLGVKELEKETKENVSKAPEPAPVKKKPVPTNHYSHKKKYKK